MTLLNFWLCFQSIACPNQYHNLRKNYDIGPPHLFVYAIPTVSYDFRGMGYFFSMLHAKSSQPSLAEKLLVFTVCLALVDLLY